MVDAAGSGEHHPRALIVVLDVVGEVVPEYTSINDVKML